MWQTEYIFYFILILYFKHNRMFSTKTHLKFTLCGSVFIFLHLKKHSTIFYILKTRYIWFYIFYIYFYVFYNNFNYNSSVYNTHWRFTIISYIYIYIQGAQEECARLRESVPYVKVYRYNPKHLCSKLNGYGDNGRRSLKLRQLLHTYWLPNTY